MVRVQLETRKKAKLKVVTKFYDTKFCKNFAEFHEIPHKSYEISCRKNFLTTLAKLNEQ
jgi:hypothetical protein